MRKKLYLILIVVITLFILLPGYVMAENDTNTISDLTADKVAIKDENNKVGEYDIEISVPGYEQEVRTGYNILFVVDASTSTNKVKWPKMKKAVLELVDELLTDNCQDNVNNVGLMTFGIGAHLNIELTNDKTAFENLPEEVGGSLLLPGRSATNNEVGLREAYKYLSGSPVASTDGNLVQLDSSMIKDKEHTYVIYLTDGNSNMNEEEYNWYDIIMTSTVVDVHGTKINTMNYMRDNLLDSLMIFDDVISLEEYKEVQRVSSIDESINKIKKLYTEKYSSNVENLTLKEIITKLEEDYSNEFDKLVLEIIKLFYKEIGYEVDKNYSAGTYERMINITTFVDKNIYYRYVENNDEYKIEISNHQEYTSSGKEIYTILNDNFEDGFYIPIFYNGANLVTNAKRAIEAGNDLANISTIYTVGYGVWREDAKKILDPNYKGGTYKNFTFEANSSTSHFSTEYSPATVDNISEVFKELIYPITKINYGEVTIVDYISKWVLPIDINNDGIFNEKDIIIKNGDKVIDNTNITVEQLSKDDINNSKDEQIKGNTNGKIYKITWKVADYLHSWDELTLSYRVKVDTQEEGFISNTEYKANGDTTLTYYIVEDSGEDKTIISEEKIYSINVPTVSQKENIIIVTKEDQDGNLLSGADFEVSAQEDGINQLKKQYGYIDEDDIIWLDENIDNKAVYFRFSGLYDFNYILKETVIPSGYTTNGDSQEINFKNIEDIQKDVVIVNEKEDTILNVGILEDNEYSNIEDKDRVPTTGQSINVGVSIVIVIISLIGLILSKDVLKSKK